MKRFAALSFTFLVSGLATIVPYPMAHAEAAKLTLTVTDIANHEGTLMIAVHDEENYDGQPVAASMVPVSGGEVSTSFDLEPGMYAIKMFHDVNDDGEMGTNPFGMPTEPFGFSNNAKGQFGPAKWEDAKFEVTDAGASQSVSLQ